MRVVYKAWPFQLQHNPRHIIASMPSAISTVQTNANSRRPSPLYLELLCPSARDEAEAHTFS